MSEGTAFLPSRSWLYSLAGIFFLTTLSGVAVAQRAPHPHGQSNTLESDSQSIVPPAKLVGTLHQAHVALAENFGRFPMSFEPNRGQADPQVQFLSRNHGYTLLLTRGGVVLRLVKPQQHEHTTREQETTDLGLELLGANPASAVTGINELAGKSSYLIGDDPQGWQTGVPNYAGVRYPSIYRGVDLVYYGNPQELEYDFVLAPGADPNSIALKVEGARQVKLDSLGNLLLETDGGEVVLRKPLVYQEADATRREVSGHYLLLGRDRVGFAVGNYDPDLPLVIDPALSYAAYLGRTANDAVKGIALGSDGSTYVAGLAASASTSSQSDAFVAHISADGSTLQSIVYLGGKGASDARGIAVDAAGNAYIAGETQAPDFPVRNPLQAACSLNAARQCAGDAFVTKLSPDGSLAFSTFLGGSGEDGANAIAVDAAGNVYVAGATASTDFPVFHAAQVSTGGQGDAFVAKMAADGSRILFATYLGGTGADEARGIAVDVTGGIYVTGLTYSLDFPTAKALQGSCRPNAKKQCAGEAFVTKIVPDGSSFAYSTYLGGSGGDSGNAIAVDASGSAYVTGETLSTDFPVAKPVQAAARGGSEAFVTKLAADGSSLAYSTYFGGSGDDYGNGISVDVAGNAFVAGRTHSADFPTKDAVQATCKKDANGACTEDAFVAVLDAAGATLEFATYLGGTGADEGRGIAVDLQGAVYLAGATTSADFPSAKSAQPSKSSVGSQITSAGTVGTPIGGMAGGAFIAKITGLSLVGGTAGAKPKARTNAAPSCTGATTWLGGAGNWSTAAKWSTGVVPNGTGVNVCIDNGNAAASPVTLDISVSVGSLIIDSDDSLIIPSGIVLVVAGNIFNAGQIQVTAAGSNTFLQISGVVSLSGGGTVTLSTTGGGTALINQALQNSTLTNVDNTIQGRGQIGNNGLALVNQAGGTFNANAPGTLLLNASSVANQGLLEATPGGTLQLSAAIYNNSGGTIAANGSGSTVQLISSVAIQGGTLNTTAGGVLGPAAGHLVTLDGSTGNGAVTNAGTYTGADGTVTILHGSIINTGAILVAAGGSNTFLQTSGAVSLSGAGTVTLSKFAGGTALINQNAQNSPLTNVDNVIQGTGQIGNNGLVLINQKTINANQPGLILLINASGVTNQGLLEATNGGNLQLSGATYVNAGANILANGSGSSVQLINSVAIQGGTLNTTGGGVLGPAAGHAATLDGSTGNGAVNNAGTFTGADGSVTILHGSIINTSTILVAAGGSNTFLQTSGAVSLSGAGTVTLSKFAGGTALINQNAQNSPLTNVDNMIQGAGQIGNNGLSLVNQSAGIINANIAGTLVLNPSGLTNLGFLEATSGGTLQLTSTTINNAGGTIKVDGASSAVQFVANATIQGGTLMTANSGILGAAAGNAITLDGATHGPLTNVGTYLGPDGSVTILVGTIANTGAIQISAGGSNTFLQTNGPVILSGGGTVTLSKSAGGTALINQNAQNSPLTNVNNIIQGTGQIGNNGLALTNQGTINANVPATNLLINPASLTNQGLLEATGGGTLQLSSAAMNNSAGTIKVDGASSAVQFVANATIQGGTLTTANAGVLGVAAGNAITLDGTTHGPLTIAGTYMGPNGSVTILIGSIINTGAILVTAGGSNTFLQTNGLVSLSGGGTVTLSKSAGGTALINQNAQNSPLTNVNNIIQGTGQIGNNGLVLTNQGTINANVATAALLINPTGLTNQGLLEATGGGTLQLSSTAFNNSAGTIKVDGGTSAVQFVANATIQGGTLTTANAGVLGVAAGNAITLDGAAHGPLTIAGTYMGPNGSVTILVGSIINNGVMQISAGGSNTFLQTSGAVTLSGGGTVTLSTSGGGTALINQNAQNSPLTNAGNTIQGTGQIGNNGLALTNQGTINANVTSPLLINPGSLTNQGLLEASSGGTLQLSNAAINNAAGTIKVDGATSAVQFVANATIQGGTLTTANAGVLGVAVGNAIALDGTAHGPLTIAGTYMGPNGSVTILVGLIINNGAIQISAGGSNTFLQTSGAVTLSGGGTVTLSTSGGGTALISQNAQNSPLTNAGNTIQGTGQIGNNGLTLVNQAGGIINANAASPLLVNPAGITNAGLLEATSGSTIQLSNSTINNAGGTIRVDGTLTTASTLSILGGTLFGAGTIAGSVTMTGVTQPGDAPLPGILTINGSGLGNFTQGSAGAFNELIGGTTAGTQFSQLHTTGTASLDGTLNVSLINGFMPAGGNQFTILMAGSLMGQFAVTNLPTLPPNQAWTITYGPASVVLTVATLSSVAVTPANPTVQAGNTLQFHATGTFSDGSMHDLTAVVTWGSSNTTVATISTTGLASALQPGMTMISATLSNINGSTTLTVPGAAMLTQVNPNTGQQGQQNLSVAITGQSTHFVQGTTTASFGAGITVASLTVNSATSATAVLNIDPAAVVGARNVTLTTNTEVATLTNGFTVAAGNFSLTVTEAGTGSGTVTSSPPGINCPTACSANFTSGTVVMLTAAPATGSTFAGWSGACTGTGACNVTMNSNQAVTATFNTSTSNFTLMVTEAGNGSGTVTSSPAGINCPTACSASFAPGTMVMLTPTAATNSTFAGWSGACSGTGPCNVTMNSNQSVTATFNLNGTVNFTLSPGPGGGTTATVHPGDTAVFLFNLLSVNGFTGTVTLSCASLQPSITCSIAPSMVTLGPGTTATMITVKTFCSWLGPWFGPPDGLPGPWLPSLGVLLALAMIVAVTGVQRRKLRVVSPLAALALFAISMAGCASVPHGPSGATPPGTYNLVITATAPGSAPQSITLTLKVL